MSSVDIKPERTHTLVIQKANGWAALGLHDVWEHRELLYYLGMRELQSAYRQTALGFSWIFLRPIISTLLLTLVFGRLIKVPTDGVPYPLFVLSAMIPWTFFVNAVTRSSRSLVDNMHVISKVYFPRLIMPISGTASGLVDFAASFIIFMIVFVLYRMPLRVEMLFLPLYVVLAFGFALAFGLWLATLSAKYRDVSFAVAFLLQTLMYLTPILYPVSLVPEQYQPIYELNPMAQVVLGFRWCLLGDGSGPNVLFLLSSLLVVVGMISGAYVFRRTERNVVDIL